MAIDMMSRWGSLPIVVGDEEDMLKVQGLRNREEGAFLVLDLEGESDIKLPPATEENVLSNLNFIAVALTKEDAIAWAFECVIDDELDFSKGKESNCGRSLTEPEIKRVAEDLVAGDFNLDFLRGKPNEGDDEKAAKGGEKDGDTAETTSAPPNGLAPS